MVRQKSGMFIIAMEMTKKENGYGKFFYVFHLFPINKVLDLSGNLLKHRGQVLFRIEAVASDIHLNMLIEFKTLLSS